MRDIESIYFEQLKNQIQAQYLKNHTPSFDDISKWKGIDIIYFQEDLRKIAKGNISEKSFYTYFKSSDNTKVPRIDMLNLLSVYAGYISWSDFKKQNPISQQENEDVFQPLQKDTELQKYETENAVVETEKIEGKHTIKVDLQKSYNENQYNKEKEKVLSTPLKKTKFKEKIWLA